MLYLFLGFFFRKYSVRFLQSIKDEGRFTTDEGLRRSIILKNFKFYNKPMCRTPFDAEFNALSAKKKVSWGSWGSQKKNYIRKTGDLHQKNTINLIISRG